MEQLIKITETNGQKAVSAFELYKALGYSEHRNFTRWKKQNISQNKFAVNGIDWVELVINDAETQKKNAKTSDCIISVDFEKRICMLARTEVGEKIRSYFVEVEKKSLNNYAIQLLKQHFEIKQRLETNKQARKALNRLVYRDTVDLQENENKMKHLLSTDDNNHFLAIHGTQQKTLFD